MQALILAAGLGRRLGKLTQHNTKCMITVNGVRLIDRMLSQLSALSLNRIIIVTGYEGDSLKAHAGNEIKGIPIVYTENPIYDKTNNIYSLALTKDVLQEDDTLLLESDLIFEEGVLKHIVDSEYPNLALVAKYESWMDGTMVQLDEDHNIVSFIPKKVFNFNSVNSYYKTVNIYKFSRKFLHTNYVPFLEAYCKAQGNNEYYEQVLRVITLLDKCELKALPIGKRKWYEIDDIQDLDIAETMFADKPQCPGLFQKRYGGYWRFPELTDFCYLVNPYFPPRKMKEEMRANFDVLLTEYPSGMQVNRLLAAKYFMLNRHYVCVGNGAAELIKSLMDKEEGKTGIVYPTFEEYPNRLAASDIIPYFPDNEDFTYTAETLKSFFSTQDIQTLLLINPDNPSGNFIPKDEVLDLCQWSQKRNIRLVVDESFVDFSDQGEQNSLLKDDILEQYPNLVVVKSISKSYGVPGLRLGIIASSDVTLIQQICNEISIWNINSFAEFYMQIFGKYEEDYKLACQKFIQEREQFGNKLSKIPFLRLIPSQANYFLCEIVKRYSSQELTEILLNQYNILIKDCSTKKAFQNRNYIRIAVRDSNDNDKLINALKEIM